MINNVCHGEEAMDNKNSIDERHANDSNDDLNLGRRRLIRGAAYVAPMVLTLRSGALAAASSCTPVKGITTVNTNGKLNTVPVGTVTGDICASSPAQCDTTNSISDGTYAGTYSSSSQKCSLTSAGQTVAILSSGAATSLNIHP